MLGSIRHGIEKSRRNSEIERLLRDIWSVSKKNCMCSLLASSGESQTATPSETCPYRQSDRSQEDITPAGQVCRAENCSVCQFFSQYGTIQSSAVLASTNKNARLQALLALGPLLVDLVWSNSTGVQEQEELKRLLLKLLCCKEDKLHCILNVGHLVQVVPRLREVCLESGWSLFWQQIRKVGSALSYQASTEAKVSVLVYLRVTCVPTGNSWCHFLTSNNETAEAQALSHFRDNLAHEDHEGSSTSE